MEQHHKFIDEVLYIKEIQPLHDEIALWKERCETRDTYIGGLEDAIDSTILTLTTSGHKPLSYQIQELQNIQSGRQAKDTWK